MSSLALQYVFELQLIQLAMGKDHYYPCVVDKGERWTNPVLLFLMKI